MRQEIEARNHLDLMRQGLQEARQQMSDAKSPYEKKIRQTACDYYEGQIAALKWVLEEKP